MRSIWKSTHSLHDGKKRSLERSIFLLLMTIPIPHLIQLNIENAPENMEDHTDDRSVDEVVQNSVHERKIPPLERKACRMSIAESHDYQ